MSLNKTIERKRKVTLTTLAICNTLYYKEKENAFIKNCKYGLFSFVLVIKLGGCMTETFSVGLQKTDKGLKVQLNF